MCVFAVAAAPQVSILAPQAACASVVVWFVCIHVPTAALPTRLTTTAISHNTLSGYPKATRKPTALGLQPSVSTNRPYRTQPRGYSFKYAGGWPTLAPEITTPRPPSAELPH